MPGLIPPVSQCKVIPWGWPAMQRVVCMCGCLCRCGCICIICISARRVQREILSSDSSGATSAVTLLCLLSKARKCGEMRVERGGERRGERIGRDRIGGERQNEISVVCHVCSESVLEPLWSLSSNEKTVLLICPTRLVLCGSVWVTYTHTHSSLSLSLRIWSSWETTCTCFCLSLLSVFLTFSLSLPFLSLSPLSLSLSLCLVCPPLLSTNSC